MDTFLWVLAIIVGLILLPHIIAGVVWILVILVASLGSLFIGIRNLTGWAFSRLVERG